MLNIVDGKSAIGEVRRKNMLNNLFIKDEYIYDKENEPIYWIKENSIYKLEDGNNEYFIKENYIYTIDGECKYSIKENYIYSIKV